MYDHSYSAPEMLPAQDEEAKRSYGVASDTWAFGCLVFNLFTGVPPFIGDAQWELFKNIRSGNWKENSPHQYYFDLNDTSCLESTK